MILATCEHSWKKNGVDLRGNPSIRMGVRRMRRLTNAFSKKWENHEAMMSLYFVVYNFCKVHGTLKTTPAVAAGLTDHV